VSGSGCLNKIPRPENDKANRITGIAEAMVTIEGSNPHWNRLARKLAATNTDAWRLSQHAADLNPVDISPLNHHLFRGNNSLRPL
jgi:hypothetical protein